MANNVFRGDMLSSIPAPKLKKNWFDLSHENKLNAGMGTLVPVDWFDGIPGDVHKINPTMLLRWQALIAPIMHRVDVSIHYFKIPKRLLFDDFEKFYTGGVSGNEQTAGIPYMTYNDIIHAGMWLAGYEPGKDDGTAEIDASVYDNSLFGLLGIPFVPKPMTTTQANQYTIYVSNYLSSSYYDAQQIDMMPIAAYLKIWLDWYRDLNLDFSKVEDVYNEIVKGGHIDYNIFKPLFTDGNSLLRRCWRKDYFTSALPQSQRGNYVILPTVQVDTTKASDPFVLSSTGAHTGEGPIQGQMYGTASKKVTLEQYSDDTLTSKVGSIGIRSDLITSSPISVELLRYGLKLQQYMERNNYAGGRYQEQLLARFGVTPKDARLQRSEYIGGGSRPVVISEVESNATTELEVTGQLAGKAKSLGAFGKIQTFCEEECIIMGLLSIMPRANYMTGLDRKWQKFDKLDYFIPEFQHIGDQAIKEKELYFGTPYMLENDFGYQQRYLEYKFRNDEIHGDLKTSLAFWHLGRSFSSTPVLNSQFVECKPDENRVFATGEDLGGNRRSIIDLYFDHKALRPISLYSQPKLS